MTNSKLAWTGNPGSHSAIPAAVSVIAFRMPHAPGLAETSAMHAMIPARTADGSAPTITTKSRMHSIAKDLQAPRHETAEKIHDKEHYHTHLISIHRGEVRRARKRHLIFKIGPHAIRPSERNTTKKRCLAWRQNRIESTSYAVFENRSKPHATRIPWPWRPTQSLP